MTQETTGSDPAAETNPKEVAADSATIAATDADRDAIASKLVDRFSLWSGAAGLIPVPIIDIAAVAGIQIQMLRRLSEIYDVPFSENRGKSIIASLAGSVIPAGTATTTTIGLASMLKGIPGIGTTVAVITMPAFSASATWVVGKVFIKHFASGGTLLDLNPPDYREFIKAQKEIFSSRPASAPPAQRSKRGTSNKEAQATSK